MKLFDRIRLAMAPAEQSKLVLRESIPVTVNGRPSTMDADGVVAIPPELLAEAVMTYVPANKAANKSNKSPAKANKSATVKAPAKRNTGRAPLQRPSLPREGDATPAAVAATPQPAKRRGRPVTATDPRAVAARERMRLKRAGAK